jgi:SH3 domain-containing protein
VLSLLRGLVITCLLAVPLLVMVVGLPRVGELISTFAPAPAPSSAAPVLQALVSRPTAVTSRPRPGSAAVEAPPPTLAPPEATATPVPTAVRAGQPATIGNTDGRGAVLRSEPATGRPVAALHERQTVFVLDRTTLGGTEWAHIRTSDGAEGWVIGVVLLPQP